MRALILLCLTLIAVSPAHAELRDVRARMSAQEGLVWLAFDGQPTMLRAERSASGVELFVEGVGVSAHQIIPRQQDIVAALEVEPTRTGARIHLQGSQPWSAAEAELRQGGVLVRVRFGAGEGPATDTASAYPAPDPAWTPTPAPIPAPIPAPVPAAASATPSAPAPARTPAPESARASAPAQIAAAAEPVTAQESPARASAVSGQAAATASAALPADVTACAAAAAAVEANPWDDARLMEHAACLGRAGAADQAGRIYEQMLAFEPDNVTAALALADLRLEQGNRAAARALYLRAAEHATSDSQALRARGQAEALRPE